VELLINNLEFVNEQKIIPTAKTGNTNKITQNSTERSEVVSSAVVHLLRREIPNAY